MANKAGWSIVAALSVAAFLAVLEQSGNAQFVPPAVSPYQTGCEAIDPNTVEGFVTNIGTGILRIDGLVRFSFTVANSMSRPSVQVQAAALIPPGRTVGVAKARLVWSLMPGESCRLDLTGAVR